MNEPNFFVQFYKIDILRQNVDDQGDWGRMQETAQVRYDLLQTFVENDRFIGFQLVLAPIRGNRPREQYPKTKVEEKPVITSDNILTKLVKGLDDAMVIATDTEFLADPFNPLETSRVDWQKKKAISVINRFSIFSRFDKTGARGVMLVVIPIELLQFPRSSPSATAAIIASIRTSIKGVFELHGKMRLATFFNVGAKSGSSLVQLHSQLYIFEGLKNHIGSDEYCFFRSYDYHMESNVCLACSLGAGHIENLGDGLDEQRKEFISDDLTVWQDELVKLRVAYAPLRYAHLRIFINRHIPHMGELADEECNSIGYAISLGDYLMKLILGSFWGMIPEDDRSIVVRQKSDGDFHLFIDMIPVYMGLGGAELLLPMSIHSRTPKTFAKLMRDELDSLPAQFQR